MPPVRSCTLVASLDRLALALFAPHGVELERSPSAVRKTLAI
jgi:hypothetical protein